jgi:hypothetical protein
VSPQGILIQGLRQKIRGLIIGVDIVNADFTPFDKISEVMQPHVQMLGPGSVFMDFRHLQGTTIVLDHYCPRRHGSALGLRPSELENPSVSFPLIVP